MSKLRQTKRKQRDVIRVFLSSTFRDMSREREHLNKVIFPEILRISRARGVEFIAIDLRWGVTQEEANQGDEVAVAIQGPTVGRHIEELDEFYVDVPASHAKRLKKLKLEPIEQEILDELIRLHRKDDHFWGR